MGWENIKHEILFTGLSKQDAIQKEIQMIKQYKSNDKRFGYNATFGGESYELTDEIRHKISESNKGRVVSPETRLKISKSEKGKYVSEESRKKCRYHKSKK